MPRSGPDGNVSNFSFAVQAVDPGLVYQMLWGFAPVDGKGRPFFLDTFNNGLSGWLTSKTGGAAVAVINSTPGFVFSPPSALLFTMGTTGGDTSQIIRKYYLGNLSKLGIEAAIMFRSDAPNPTLRIDFCREANVVSYNPELRYNQSTNQWQVKTANPSTYTNIQTGNPAGTNWQQLQIKFVGDWSTGKYVRAMIGDNVIDISALSMPISANTFNFYAEYMIGFVANALGANGFVGYVLLTKDEL